MLKKSSLLFLLAAVGLWAADYWTKPFTQWNEKETQKMIQDSPWAHQSNYEGAAFGAGGPNGGAGGATKGGTRGQVSGVVDNGDDGGGGGGGGKGGGGRGGGPAGQSEGPVVVATTPVMVRWQSARPIKEAMLKQQYGAEVNTSPEAKKILEREEMYYVLYVGMPSGAARGVAQKKDALLQGTILNLKGNDDLKPADVQFNVRPTVTEMYFLFPRTKAISLDDKEVEFICKIDRMTVKYKFKLKDMVINNKLEL